MANCACLSEPSNAGHIQSSRPHTTFVATAIDDRRNLHTRALAAHVQSADALGTVHLVGRDGSQIEVLLDYVNWDFADSLSRVSVEDHTLLMTKLADFRDRLQHANFVVGSHDRDQNGLVIHRALQVIEIHQAVFLYWQVGHPISIFLQPLASIEHRLVLGDRSNDVITLLAIHLRDTLNREVVALGSPGSKDDLLRRRADQLCDTLTRRLNRFFSRPP